MQKNKSTKHLAKKAMLKKMLKGKTIGKSPTGASPFKMDNGLGNLPVSPSGSKITGGAGSNLGKNGIF